MPDGKHFIGVVAPVQREKGFAPCQQMHLILNWFEELKQRAGR